MDVSVAQAFPNVAASAVVGVIEPQPIYATCSVWIWRECGMCEGTGHSGDAMNSGAPGACL